MTLEERINTYYDVLSANDRYICECILNHKEECIRCSIDEFAYNYHISTSALSRFAQKLKLPGYSELRTMMRLQAKTKYTMQQSEQDMMECYKKCITYIDKKDCTRMFERMHQAKRIILFGEGYSQSRIVKEIKRIFLPTGKIIYDIYGFDMIKALTNFIKEGDIVLFISFHGEAKELVDFATQLKVRGLYTISITNMVSNTLSHICHDNLYIHSIVLQLENEEPYEITTPYFILMELFYIKYEMYYKEVNKFAESENLCE